MMLTIDDFNGVSSKNSTFFIYLNSKVFFRIYTVLQKSEHKFEGSIKTKVEMNLLWLLLLFIRDFQVKINLGLIINFFLKYNK